MRDMTRRGPVRRLLLLGCCALLLSACAQPEPSPTIEPSLVGSHAVTLKGQRYSVHRVRPGENLFAVRTADGQPGDRRAMLKVVRLAYNCHAVSLRETAPDWRVAEARGAICKGGHERFRRGR